LLGGLCAAGSFNMDAQSPSAPAASAPAATAAAPAPAQSFKGCVQQSTTEKSTLVLSTDTVCATLTGKFTASRIAGHEIEIKGVLTPRTAAAPASIRVDGVVEVGKACTDVCSLRPPGSRGLTRGGEIPGREGGTPGEAPSAASPNP
jgi:hypothetical protein